MAVAMGAQNKTAQTEMKAVVDFAIEMAKDMKDSLDMTDQKSLVNKMKISDMTKKWTDIKWLTYINWILDPEKGNGGMKDTDKVNVMVPQYFDRFVATMEKKDKKVIANYMAWTGLVRRAPKMMNQKMRDIALQFQRKTK